MAPLSDYVTGTITLTNGSAAFTGTGTGWLAAAFREGDTVLGIEDNPGVTYVIESITDNDAGTLTQPWDGPTGTYEYRMRYLADGQRVTAQARTLIELLGNGNLQALAGLSGTPNTLAMFTGAGAMVEVPRTDLVSGADYDVQVDTLPDRDAYDGQDEGFSVLVSNTGDGRAAIYSKLSAASGDWSDPAYVTGPSTDVTVGTVTELDYGDTPTITGTSGPGTLELDFGLPGGPALSVGAVTRGDADVVSTPVAGGYELDFTIPSQVAQGDYSGATAYVTGDVVQYQGSSWVALQATTGNAPPTLPTTSNAYWQLLARAGNDGAGTVTTVVAGDGIDVDSTDPTEPIISGVLFDEDVQGQVPGPTEEDILAGRVLKADGTWGDSVDSLFLDDLTGDFDANEKAQARENIDALGPDETADRAFRRGNILGPVSQSGGVPTGAIIESGANANGEYVRYADGTQICYCLGSLVWANNNFLELTWSFPAGFAAAPIVVWTCGDFSNSAITGPAGGLQNVQSVGSSSATVRQYRITGGPNFQSGDTIPAYLCAVGRWF